MKQLSIFIFIIFNLFYPSNVSSEEATTSFSDADLVATPPFLDHPRISSLGGIVTFSSKNCTGSGDDSEGSLACRQSDSNGGSLVLTSDYETSGNEFQAQTRISARDASGREKETKTIRHKIRHVTLGNEKVKEAEFFDIVKHLPTGKMTREIFLYEYHLETQRIKRVKSIKQ